MAKNGSKCTLTGKLLGQTTLNAQKRKIGLWRCGAGRGGGVRFAWLFVIFADDESDSDDDDDDDDDEDDETTEPTPDISSVSAGFDIMEGISSLLMTMISSRRTLSF
ncbi:hypothetical protein EVAR_104027_1 [Eumeta japonica]|uniref:Uncharacterized protein n=1 Tax=Eumeta variegata TaxID=151549 RepID=A0A4C1Z8W8_EUMVA|nr:hypothetical protein EVAR_104027_1 [Eumeta japonica]